VAKRRTATMSLALAFMLGSACYALFSGESPATSNAETNNSVQAQPEKEKPLARMEVDEDGRVSGSFDLQKLAENMWKRIAGG
jgi:hypothetical protein